MQSLRTVGISIILFMGVFAFILAFIGGPDYYAPRSYQYAWNLGHVLAFSIWTYLCLFYFHKVNRLSFLEQLYLFLIVAAVLGSGIEMIQSQIGRASNWNDVINDVLGSMLAVFLFSPQRHQITRTMLFLSSFILVFTIVAHNRGLVVVLIDDYHARQQFPVLADFSAPFEVSRWQGGSIVQIALDSANAGDDILKIDFTTERYSGVRLQHFPRDWQGYTALQLEYYNPSEESIYITCRIHDRTHVKGDQLYSDRFNRLIQLHPGWHNFQIRIQDIVNAPMSRQMDINDIMELGVFVSRQKHPQTLYISEVRLIR